MGDIEGGQPTETKRNTNLLNNALAESKRISDLRSGVVPTQPTPLSATETAAPTVTSEAPVAATQSKTIGGEGATTTLEEKIQAGVLDPTSEERPSEPLEPEIAIRQTLINNENIDAPQAKVLLEPVESGPRLSAEERIKRRMENKRIQRTTGRKISPRY